MHESARAGADVRMLTEGRDYTLIQVLVLLAIYRLRHQSLIVGLCVMIFILDHRGM